MGEMEREMGRMGMGIKIESCWLEIGGQYLDLNFVVCLFEFVIYCLKNGLE